MMGPRRRNIRHCAYLFVPGLLVLAAACATLPEVEVAPGDGGRLDVRVVEEQSVRALAVSVYGDVKLADALAEAAGIRADRPVEAGTELSLPSKSELERRIDRKKRAAKLLEEGAEAAHRQEWEKAARKYRESLEVDPSPGARQALGVALLKTGDLDTSLRLLAEGSILYPDDADIRYAYGAALRESGNLPDALEELNAAAELDEHHARAHYDRARTLRDLGRTDEARAAYREFLFAFPDDPWAEDARRQLDELGS